MIVIEPCNALHPGSMFSERLDVRKQKDLSGFYRHLYKQEFGEEDSKQEKEEKDKR